MRIGVVGSGSMGARHAVTWRELGESVAGYSPTPAHRARLADYGRVLDSLPALLDSVDVVDICTPTDTHLELAIAAAERELPVICEKPIARTIADAERMLELPVPLFVGHLLRYFGPHAAARKSGVRSIEMYRAVEPPAADSWLRDEKRSGGVLVDLMIHDLDYVRWVAGEVVSVRARKDGIERAEVWLEHAGGAQSHIVNQWGGDPADRAELDGVVVPTGDAGQAFRDQFTDFRTAISTGSTPRVTAADAVAALRIALAADESARTGRSISL
jgi:myo-inositol 2-dehydrogenase / D-chiro-inositol 1-dehydrogenase